MSGEGGEVQAHVFSLIEEPDEINVVNTMYMYFLDFTVFFSYIGPSSQSHSI